MTRRQRRRTPAPDGAALIAIGTRIREVRVAKGLTQEELGSPYLTGPGVSKIETGNTSPALKTLVHFARRLECRVRDLIPPELGA